MSRSLKSSSSGSQVLQQARKLKALTISALSEEVQISRSTVTKFFAGESVDQKTFINLCEFLAVDWREVTDSIALTPQSIQPSSENLEALVKRLRWKGSASIQQRCGAMRVLDMTTPIGLGAIYTDVNVLERLASKTRRDLSDLMDCDAEAFDRFGLGKMREKRVDGLQAVALKGPLMILGRPGAGKTTFMKRLATMCNERAFLAQQVPIFIPLKEWAETSGKPGLLELMVRPFSEPIEVVQEILEAGRGLVLLDGLDEVLEADHERTLKEIREFSQKYSDNHILITSRIAAQEYLFQQFTEVEVADFSDEQIQEFANRWFLVRQPEAVDDEGRSTVGQLFWDALSDREPVKELAANPLLLTLLCLEFENSVEFPKSRAELYERGLHVLLGKWDGQRQIRRDSAYGKLSVKRKESLLAQLAIATFSRGEYFFKERVAMQEIGKYIENLPDARSDDDLLVDSRSVLRDIVAQHGLLTERATGIYSFSHLTFHEYFVARSIVDSSNPVKYEAALSLLMEHVADKRWREVFLLVVERSEDAGYVLSWMKRKIDWMLAGDEDLQKFLVWVKTKATEVDVPYKPAAVRAFYFAIALALTIDRYSSINRNLADAIDRSMSIDYDRDVSISIAMSINLATDPDNCALQQQLQQLRDQIPSDSSNLEKLAQWWKSDGKTWIEQLHRVIIEDQNIGQNWQLNESQKEPLQKYYYANILLVDCLKSECYANRQVLQHIEDTLLLPLAEIPLAPL